MKRSAGILASLAAIGLTTGCSPVAKTKSAFHSVKQGFTRDSSKPAAAKEEAPVAREGKRVYIVIEENGQRRSTGYQIRQHSTFRGHPCVVLERVRTQILQRGRERFKKTIQQKSITAVDGAALYATTVTLTGGERTQETVTISKGKAVFESVGPTGRKRSTIDVPRGIMFGIEPSWLIAKDIKVGRRYTAQVLDRGSERLVTENVTIRGHHRENVLGRETDVWLADSQREGATPVQMVFTEAGDIVRLQADTIVFRVVSRDEAENDSVPVARIVSSISTDTKLPAWDTYAQIAFEARPASAWRPYAHTTEYAEVRDEGERLFLILRKKVLTPTNATLPMAIPEAVRPYLASAKSILPEKRAIAETARRILRDESNALRAVALLAGWVHQAIRFGASGTLNPSPLSTLENRRGDCSEHADLFASLARSQGIPTRHCLGLILQSDKAVYHTWIEVWIGGKWIPVDTTVNRVGLPAGYFLTAHGVGNGLPKDEFAWRMRKGDLNLHLASATREFIGHGAHTLVPGTKRSYIAQAGNWLANLYWGFALELPEGWDGVVKLSYVEMTSRDPKRPAKVKCEAMSEQYRVRESTLDRIVQSLQDKFGEYRTLEARILPLPTGPRIPGRPRSTSSALMVDFTCKTGKTPLRCRQYIIPKRGRSYRIWIAAPADGFMDLMPHFRAIIDSLEL